MKLFLTRRDLGLSWQALALVAEVRWRLWRLPFAVLQAQWRVRVQAALGAAALDAAALDDGGETPDQIRIAEVWDCSHAVRRAARLVPMASCLTQAMALQMMLARRGQHCDIRIGVERRISAPAESAKGSSHAARANPLARVARGSDVADGQFRAHAWVEWHGRVLIGGDVRGWKPLALFAAVTPPTSTPPG